MSDPEENEPETQRRRLVVGIGASAGGLEPLGTLIRSLVCDGMAYVVLQHMAADHESALAEILARGASVRVLTAAHGMPLEASTVYVTPPGKDITVQGGVLQLQAQSAEVPRHSIDSFLRSLAADQGSASVAVILSGSGDDGALGARAVREAGGITFAQEPSTAQHPSMPQSVIDLGMADFALAPAEIGEELARLSAHPFVARRRPQRLWGQGLLDQIFDRLRRVFGVDFAGYKPTTIERRLGRRLALRKLERGEDYLTLLDSDAEELKSLYGDLLIGVTAFFRDRETFELLESTVVPRLFAGRSPDSPVRVWVPGCSSGEEAYSIAMCVIEHLDTLGVQIPVQIFATDIDDRALARARLGLYPLGVELDISAGRLQRFFTRQGDAWQVSQRLRAMVIFAHHNLGKDPPFSRLDLVSCRNVLIYMQPSLQKRVLRVFHYALKPDGFLQLGASESVGDAAELFSLVDRRLKLYSRKSAPPTGVFDLSSGSRGGPFSLGSRPALPTAEHRPMVSTQQLADRMVLEKFGPPGMLVDEKLDVIQFRGQTGPYLGPSAGVATLNVLKLVRPELLPELRQALQTAASHGVEVTSGPVALLGSPASAAVVVDVMPLRDGPGREQCLLVMFRDAPTATAAAAAVTSEEAGATQVRALETELLVTKEYLQTSVRELEVANEELQTANEELQSTNEELQSTNEELETSKEELQSTNEELSTINEELQNRIGQLNESNDDLQNVLADVSTPLVLVGMDLRIRRFSAAAEQLLHLIAEDVGRPVARLEAALNPPPIEAPDAEVDRTPLVEPAVAETIRSLQECARRVRASDGHWYTMRTIPYRTLDHAIRGAVIEFTRAPPARKGTESVEIHEMVGKVLSTLPHVLMLLDEHMRLVWVNKAFFDTFHVGAEVLGRTLDEVWPARASEPVLWSAFEEAVARGKSFAEMVVEHPFGREGERPMKFSARALAATGDRPALTLVLIEETR
nr:PAS domain-containing protein [Deltaproteobacteria bacterium]